MAYNVAAGNPQYSDNYIPEYWEPQMQEKFYKSLVIQDIANTNYQGSIKGQGDTVQVRRLPTITINTHREGEALKSQLPDRSKVQLLIDNGRYFAFEVGDVNKTQADQNLVKEFSTAAGRDLAVEVDKVVLQGFYSDASSSNIGLTAGADSAGYNMGTTGTNLSLTKENILDTIVDLNRVLDEQSIPEEGRWLVLPPIFIGLLKKSDLKDSSMTGDDYSVLRNGKVGMIDATTIYKSRNLLTGGSTYWYCVFGHPVGVTFASQLDKTESLRNPNAFGDIVRGLQVFGFKGIDETAFGYLVAAKG